MGVLTDSDYPAIRAIIDTKITKSDLPDEIMGQPTYHDAVEKWVEGQIDSTQYNALDDTKKSFVRLGAMYWMASLLLPAAARVTSVSISTNDLSYSRPPMDIEKRQKELRTLADSAMESAIGSAQDTSYKVPTMFTKANSRTGQ